MAVKRHCRKGMKKPQNCLTVWGFKVLRTIFGPRVAERQGFEPWVPQKGTTVFETAPIDHSGIFPWCCARWSCALTGAKLVFIFHLGKFFCFIWCRFFLEALSNGAVSIVKAVKPGQSGCLLCRGCRIQKVFLPIRSVSSASFWRVLFLQFILWILSIY